MNANDYLDAIRKSHDLRSYSEVAELLNISRQAVSQIRNGGPVSESTANRIGRLLKIPGEKVYADVKESRAPDNESRAFWHKIANKVASMFLIVGLFLGMPYPTEAGPLNTYYGKSRRSLKPAPI